MCGIGDPNILPIPLPDINMVDEMPWFQMGVHPECPVMDREEEDGIYDQELMHSTGLEQ